MLKRVMMMGLAASVGLATMNAVIAEAGGWTYLRPPGMWWYYGSVGGCAKIGRVPNPLKHPAAVQCDVTIVSSHAQCVNPQYHNVLPGEAANKYFELRETIDPEDMSLAKKEKGVANVCLEIDDENYGVQCKLRNWHPEVLVTEFVASCTTQECLDADCLNLSGEVKDTQSCSCELPDGVDFDNVKACNDPFDSNEDCTRYQCKEVEYNAATEVWEETGNQCQLTE